MRSTTISPPLDNEANPSKPSSEAPCREPSPSPSAAGCSGAEFEPANASSSGAEACYADEASGETPLTDLEAEEVMPSTQRADIERSSRFQHQHSDGRTHSMSMLHTSLAAAALTAWAAVCAEFLLKAVDEAAAELQLTAHFAALVVVPMVGNIDTLVAAVRAAVSDNIDLALTLGLGSAIQITTGVIPALVLFSWLLSGRDLLLDLHEYEALVLFLAVIVIGTIVRRARSTYLEGVLLLGAYSIVAATYQMERPTLESDGECRCGDPACCVAVAPPLGSR